MDIRLNKRIVALIHLIFITAIFLGAPFAFPYSVTLSWNAPTKNADGTPLVDLAGYKVYYRSSSGNYSQNINVGNVTTKTVNDLTDGLDYYFAVTAYDISGNESGYSNEVSAQQNNLAVTKGGTGTGTVTSSPGGIVCGSDCSEAYKSGTVVTLTPIPNTGSTFTGWSGGGCSGNAPQCSLTISATAAVVAANFSSLTPLTQTETIIDNRDSATSRTGSWDKSGGANPYGSDSVWGRDGETFTWRFSPPTDGSYEVALWWTDYSSRSTSIPVDINYSGGKVRVYLNQQKDGGKWNLLGKYNFKGGTTYDVTIISQSNPTSTCADAVKFTNVAANFSSLTPLTQTETIIDNRDSATSRTGSWDKSGGANPYGSDSVWGRDGETFTWRFSPPTDGSYEVALWWTDYSSRSTSIPVDINYSGGKETVYLNQQKDGGKWNLLGKYNFKGGTTYDVTIISQSNPTSTCADAVKFTLAQ